MSVRSNLDFYNLYHTTSLHHAASYNSSAVRLLIDRYHDHVEDLLESRDLCGNTPIHRSANSCPNALLQFIYAYPDLVEMTLLYCNQNLDHYLQESLEILKYHYPEYEIIIKAEINSRI